MQIGTADRTLRCGIGKDSPNQSVCITGLSGTGKTVRLQQIELSAIQEGGVVIVVDVGSTHVEEEVFEPLRGRFSHQVNCLEAMDGLGLGIFRALESPQGKKEPFTAIVNSAVQALSSGMGMGVCQQGALREAVIEAVQSRGAIEDEAAALAYALKSREGDRYVDAVYNKLWTLLHCGVLKASRQHMRADRINIFNLSGLDEITQTAIVELILHTLWRKIRFLGPTKGRPKLTVVLDEFQNLPLKRGSILCSMLREGRKFGINFLLATQTLEGLPKNVAPLISQTAVRLYFRPAPSEIKSIAKTIDFEKAAVWEKILSNLKVGECIAVGEFEVNGAEVKRPLKLSGIDF